MVSSEELQDALETRRTASMPAARALPGMPFTPPSSVPFLVTTANFDFSERTSKRLSWSWMAWSLAERWCWDADERSFRWRARLRASFGLDWRLRPWSLSFARSWVSCEPPICAGWRGGSGGRREVHRRTADELSLGRASPARPLTPHVGRSEPPCTALLDSRTCCAKLRACACSRRRFLLLLDSHQLQRLPLADCHRPS